VFLCSGDILFDLFAASGQQEGPGSTAVTLSGNAGGSPMNVALGLARLGHHSRFFTKLSSDLFGLRLRQYLSVNQVDTELCIDTSLNTTLAIVETKSDGSADYVFYINDTADASVHESDLPTPLPADVRVLHFGSYSTVVDPVASTLLSLARREKEHRLISFDPNLRLSIEPDIDRWREVFEHFASTATLVKASDEDIKSLMGENSEERFVASCFDRGVELVFVTRGPNGSSGYLPDGKGFTTPGQSVSVIDTVGAGDTFQAAILHHLAANNHISATGTIAGEVDVQKAIEFATKAASVTCTRAGADLPTLQELM